MKRVLAINGSYRHDGTTDQIVAVVNDELLAHGADVETIQLREYPIEFCLNCRECTQQPGTAPARCVQHDDMRELIVKIERADAFILASPTNFGSATALFKRFMERLVVYGYWPWGRTSPDLRKRGQPQKKAILISSCSAPGIVGRWLYATTGQLKTTAKVIGAQTVGTLVAGHMANEPHPHASRAVKAKAKRLASRLI